MPHCRPVLSLLLALLIGTALSACDRSSSSSFSDIRNTNIIAGSFAAAGAYPFAINIWFHDPKEGYVAHHCGGSLVHKKWVLTAAHCVMEDESEQTLRVVSSQKLKLFVNGLKHSGVDATEVKIRKIHVHPDYQWPRVDVALIELEKDYEEIAPVTLSTDNHSKSSEVVTVVGWGLSDAQGLHEPDSLKELSAPLLPLALCAQDPFPVKKGYSLGIETLCIQTQKHSQSSCPGDSGGPLLIQKANQWQQVGIVSWGSACAGKRSLDGSSVGGYASVFAALPWIKSMINPQK